MASDVSEDVVDEGETHSRAASSGEALTPQQRFERSTIGKVLISGLVVVVLLLNVLWNLPAKSPISRGLQQFVAPIAVPAGLDQGWGMFTEPATRVVFVEVDVTMANGEKRVWQMQPGAPGVGWWARWTGLKNQVVRNPTVRPPLARWVVSQVTTSDEHPVSVAIVMRTENLSKPGDEAAGRSPADKVLYQETLAAPS